MCVERGKNEREVVRDVHLNRRDEFIFRAERARAYRMDSERKDDCV